MRKPLVSAVLLVIFALLLALPAAAEEAKQIPKPIAEMSVSPISVDWQPTVEYERVVLTVAGPEGFYIHQELESGQAPSLSLFQPNGERLPDGPYAYELRAEVGGLTEGPLVQAGHLWVEEESFVSKVPTQPSPPSERGSASRPPIRNITAQDSIIPDDLVVQGHACIGPICTAVVPGDPGLTLKEDFGLLQIKFENIACCHPSTIDWALQANDGLNATGDFLIRNVEPFQEKTPFRISSSAPDNALTIGFNGNIGLGTSTPSRSLDVSRPGVVDVGFYNSSSTHAGGGSASPTRWFFQVDNDPNRTFKISREGGGGAVLTVNARNDANGVTFKVDGSVQATNVVYTSSRDSKKDFEALEPQDVLARVAKLPISEWSFKEGPEQVRHIGPMAEDFHDAFGLNPDAGTISVTDTSGVALAAIQGLLQRIEELEKRNTELMEQLHELKNALPQNVP